MTVSVPQVYNIVAGAPFLETLALAVLRGFPGHDTTRPLSDWTILLPTRRAARAFGDILLTHSGKKALILPRIQPIGDLDEFLLQDDMQGGDLAPAMSATATLVELTRLIKTWALQNQHLSLSQDVLASPSQAVHLAQNLTEIIITAETHQLTPDALIELYNKDIAEHRQTITSLLEMVLRDLPAQQASEGTMGATARRSAMIRAEAKRITQRRHRGPIIAAGSTGTIPATRELLAAIALHPEGAVILPGLDGEADDASWATLTEEHPQFALKNLISAFGIARSEIKTLGKAASPRNMLLSEMFRPTETTPMWRKNLPAQREVIARAVHGVTEITCADRHLEARTIAVILRDTLNHTSKTAALVTPDRDLASRVVAEMQRWGVTVYDSAGEALSRHGLGAALDLLLQAMLDDFEVVKLFAFLRHPLVNLGIDGLRFHQLLENFDLAVMRGPAVLLSTYSATLTQARARSAADHHLHPAVKGLTDEQWSELEPFAQAVDDFIELLRAPKLGLTAQIAGIETAARFALAPGAWLDSESAVLEILENLKSEGQRRADITIAETVSLIRHLLHTQMQPPVFEGHPQLAILGTLEARLLPFDVMILGGLNETIWPRGADPGPWLNRTMRDELKLPMPERALGMAAHDFEQGLATSDVYVTWSKRLNNAPQSPSRWLLRLKAVLETAGVAPLESGPWLGYAQSLSQGLVLKPATKPAPAPPVAARPVRFSVTEVEKLIRNPYAVYAKRILKLEPLPGFAERPDERARGSLFHDAIGKWNEQQAPSLALLLAEGDRALATLGADSDIRHFWAPHFQRLAQFLWDAQLELGERLLKIHAECNGKLNFELGGIGYTLTARADRIDILENAAARIIDYKTGTLPSTKQVKANFSPQMTLQAAMVLLGAFSFQPSTVAELIYFRIGGGQKALEKKHAVEGGAAEIGELAQAHLASFKNLLTFYQDAGTTYLPRLLDEKEDEEQDFDHLSRYLEWQLAQASS